jgi:hypothetical protein
MDSTPGQRSNGVASAAFVIILGGAAAMAAAFLTWMSLETGRIGRDVVLRGMSMPAGKVALIAGIGLVVVGVGLWLVHGLEVRRWLAVAALMLGGVVVGAAIAELQSDVTALARELLRGDRLPPAARSVLGRGQGRELVELAIGPGVFLALTGGLVGLTGGVAGVFSTTMPAPHQTAGGVARSGSTSRGETFSKGRTA